ncbi:glutamate formimidoyltransferase, partial [bacterium]
MSDNRIVECVPNFSEGRDMKIIEQIADAIRAVDGVELKDIDPGAATNRTVVTFVGNPDGVVEAAFQAIKKAAEIIDMRKHHGTHPRMGATDVCPFVPVTDVTMDDCAALAKILGERVGEELKIPVYLYENAATSPERRNLAYVRHGEYEGLPEKLADPEMKPDFGPAKFDASVAKTGATAICGREFLIAYNVNLNTTEKNYATDIAFELREKGRSARRGNIEPFYFRGKIIRYEKDKYPCGDCNFVAKTFTELEEHTQNTHNYSITALLKSNNLDPNNIIGKAVKKSGLFKFCKSIGWFVDDYKIAQISINLTNYKITPPQLVLEKTRELAAKRGIVVTGSEVVGLIPYPAIIEAGKYYLRQQDKSTGIPSQDIIHYAVRSMGLTDVSKFDSAEKIIGLPKIPDNALVKLETKEFVDEVSRESPAPGGGSVAALAGAIGSALASMVANLTANKHSAGELKNKLISLAEKAQEIKDALIRAVDEDTQAFNDYLDAIRMPKKTDDE